MKKKALFILSALTLTMSVFTGCGEKNSSVDASITEINESKSNSSITEIVDNDDTEIQTAEIIEVTEDATSTAEEDGSITIETKSGDTIVVKPTDKKETNSDGTVTYTTDGGQKVTVDESTGSATVTSQVTVPSSVESNNATQSNNTTQSDDDKKTNSGHVHSYTYSVDIAKDATCTEVGEKELSCACGESYFEEIPKTSHTPSDWKVTKEPTETTTGTKVKTCTVCGATIETATIDKAPHSHNYTWTYMSDGDYKVNKCSCGEETGERAYNLGNGVYGQWKDDKAEELMVCTNIQRGNSVTTTVDEIGNYTGCVVSPPLNNTLSKEAKQRALECVYNYSHDRLYTEDECLAKGYKDARSVSSAWMESADHRWSSTDYRYTNGGTACLWYDEDGNGTMNYLWVLTLDY